MKNENVGDFYFYRGCIVYVLSIFLHALDFNGLLLLSVPVF